MTYGNMFGGTSATTPWWLPKFAQGEVAGQPMQGYPVKIPSGQLWSRTPYSQRMGLQSYINRYAGSVPGMIADYQDLIDRLTMMLPRRAPTRAARWMIPRQW
jgi:hypothetical protein